jgi:probable rRNA maturation factor
MPVELYLENVSSVETVPSQADFERWLEPALQDHPDAILNIRIVDADESAELNWQYRRKQGPTNVLSFPAAMPDEGPDAWPVDLPEEVDLPLLGDLAICAPLVESEAAAQHKSAEAHWAHLVIHGTLHLFGYDHQEDAEAEVMEGLEIELLATLGYANPYADSRP